jgi:D-sedoheptulose 7-phosphate isomerase
MRGQGIGSELGRLTDEFFASRAEAYRRAVDGCVAALRGGRKILALGNGGSAAEAQHFTAELVNTFSRPRPALRALTLSADTSVLTSIGNDIAYEAVFSRQIEALGDAGDALLALTTSGGSPNVLRALEAGRARGF